MFVRHTSLLLCMLPLSLFSQAAKNEEDKQPALQNRQLILFVLFIQVRYSATSGVISPSITKRVISLAPFVRNVIVLRKCPGNLPVPS